MKKTTHKLITEIIKVSLFLSGLFLFAGFLHKSTQFFILSIAGLSGSVLIIITEIQSFNDLYILFGLHGITKSKLIYLPLSILTGLIFGVIYRSYLHVGIFPGQLTYFAMTAIAIGSVEEVMFRGYLQSRLRKINAVLSIILPTCAHTIYKLLLFIPFQSEPDIKIGFIVQWTFIGGLVFALLKEFSQNTLFPVLSHASFDFLVYGDNSIVAWWVWV